MAEVLSPSGDTTMTVLGEEPKLLVLDARYPPAS